MSKAHHRRDRMGGPSIDLTGKTARGQRRLVLRPREARRLYFAETWLNQVQATGCHLMYGDESSFFLPCPPPPGAIRMMEAFNGHRRADLIRVARSWMGFDALVEQ